MLTQQQQKELINRIPQGTIGEELRIAYSVIAGVRDEKSAQQIAQYYSADITIVEKWISFFDFENSIKTRKSTRGRKGKDINSFIKSNTGKIVSPKSVSEELGISLPTFYNFYNTNRHLFKKVKRGEFEILNPGKERGVSK